MGLDDAERHFGNYSAAPKLRLQAGDRARFHFLSTGYDIHFAGGRFHDLPPIGDQTYGRSVVCIREFTDGEEVCAFCEEGAADFSNQFAVWALIHCIYHNGDNPDSNPDAEPWEQFKLGGRIVFKETIEESLLIWLRAGRAKSRFLQFKGFAVKYGSLEDRLFELRRAGSGIDTDYALAVVKEEKLAKKAVEEAKEGLLSVEDIFRSAIGGGPAWIPPRISEDGSEEPAADEEMPVSEADLPSVEEVAEGLV